MVMFAVVWICPPQDSYDENRMPNVIELGGGAFGKWLDHEGSAPINGIIALLKETLEGSIAPSTMWGH